jgi:hypothetical protein
MYLLLFQSSFNRPNSSGKLLRVQLPFDQPVISAPSLHKILLTHSAQFLGPEHTGFTGVPEYLGRTITQFIHTLKPSVNPVR